MFQDSFGHHVHRLCLNPNRNMKDKHDKQTKDWLDLYIAEYSANVSNQALDYLLKIKGVVKARPISSDVKSN